MLLTYIIELVSKESFESFLRKEIFKPLGMHSSGYDTTQEVLPERASGYSRTKEELSHAEYLDMSWAGGAGGLYSTVDDLLLWDQALSSNTLLSEDSKQKLFGHHSVIFDPLLQKECSYGYGWRTSDELSRKCYAHSGRIYGFSSELLRFPDDQLSIIVLSNIQEEDTTGIALKCAQKLLGL